MATDVTVLLERISRGEAGVADQLFPLVYKELREQARRYMANERAGHTLEATALVHEAYVRLFGESNIQFKGKGHFFHAAAQAMRRILVDHARARNTRKRGGAIARLDLADVAVAADAAPPGDILADAEQARIDWEALDRALDQLAETDQRRFNVVLYRYFAGLEISEIAEIMDVNRKTIQRDWTTARAFLLMKMAEATPPADGDGQSQD